MQCVTGKAGVQAEWLKSANMPVQPSSATSLSVK